jgi:hypothetical protein
MSNCPLLSRKIIVLGRIEDVPGTAVSLIPNDGRARVYAGATPEYNAPREKRDVALASLSNIGSLESTKAINTTFRVEANTPDDFYGVAASLEGMGIDQIRWDAGFIHNIAHDGSEDFANVLPGMYYTVINAVNPINNGTFLITNVDDGSDVIEIINPNKDSDTGDDLSDSTAVGYIQRDLEFAWSLIASGCGYRALSCITIGAITGNKFVRGDIITGTTSGATGRVLKPVLNGELKIHFDIISGTFVSGEVLTGSISGATTTSALAPTVKGFAVKPFSGCHEVATVDFENDGFHWGSRSAMANMSFEAAANKAMFLDFAFEGPKEDIGDKTMTVTIKETEAPPIVKNSQLKLDAFEPVFSGINFDMGNNIVQRENGNATGDSGIEGAKLTSREPKITLSCEHELAATFDFFDKLDQGTKVALQMSVGTVLDKLVWFFADSLEFAALPVGEKDGITSLEVEAMCTGTDDDEWEMLFI